LARVLPVVRVLAGEGLVVSVDTRHASVARACVDEGAAIINDISGFADPAMVAAAQASSVGLVVMHMQGDPQTMQLAPAYVDVVAEVEAFLLRRARELEVAGIAHERICIDPGPGFGKTSEHNLALLRATPRLAALGNHRPDAYAPNCDPIWPESRRQQVALPDVMPPVANAESGQIVHKVVCNDLAGDSQCYPLMAAYSRKGFIGTITGVAEPAERVAGSVTVALLAAQMGARVLRVHDVAPTVETLKLLAAVSGW
jgi:dihydropteroate synthase